jgi:DNA-binding beta-propeller fold protein YncE
MLGLEPFEKTRLLVVEGKDEENFFEKLLEHKGGIMSKLSRLFYLSVFLPFFCFANGNADYHVKTVDFLSQFNLKVNAAGPLMVKTDIERNRIILVNTNTSSISLIDGNNYSVTNIPIKTRIPQYLKMEAMTIDQSSGNIYVIGNKSLHIVFPDQQTAVTIDTDEQYEMVAVNEKNGDAFLVGRESKYLAMIPFKSKKINPIPWVDQVEKMINLNQTPPPPIRKVVCDTSLQQVITIDGYTASLYLFSANSGKLLKKRKLEVKGGTRWHMAGYNPDNHHLYTVIETTERSVNEAIKIDVLHGKDKVAALPGLTEAVGVDYNPSQDEVYIPYDNHPTVHLVDFKNNGDVKEIKIPHFGNDASVIDEKNHRLYVSSWGYGEVEVIDLETRELVKRIQDAGIIPHMFNMTFNPHTGKLIIPIGASAVNGSFGAALTILDPGTEKKSKIYTGWAPTALAEMKSKDGFLVFNSEDQAAEVLADGSVKMHTLPCEYTNNAVESPSGTIFISYGPHQSYWPDVYIWAAKNGILSIDFDPTANIMNFYDRRIPRMAHQMVLDKNEAIYALQNNWGSEKQFLISFPDEIRVPNLPQLRIELEDFVLRETTQRILKYDKKRHWLYILRLGETDEEIGLLQIFDLDSHKILLKYPTGLTPTDLIFDEDFIYIANFDSNTITIVKKDDFSVQKIKTGEKPFKLAQLDHTLYCIDHNDNSLQAIEDEGKIKTYPLPYPGKPGNLFCTGKNLIIASHSTDALHILSFSPDKESFQSIHKEVYPYGETTVDTNNSAFYLRGQFADGIFEINQIKQDKKDRLWITDYLSGKLFIITPIK